MNLRAPYTREEWAEICHALKDERKRRQLEHLPRQDQMTIVDRVLEALRSPTPES